MTEQIGSCWHCGRALTKHDYGRESLCLGCSKPTRVCRNCNWYQAGVPDDCREPTAERVMEKERANFCDHFEATERQAENGEKRDDSLSAAEALFK